MQESVLYSNNFSVQPETVPN
ncbi:Protein of unknown function [Pyronema omphalodes CBS 100304]|uniref:Uncharacterized protein n=1 Tax=Pyronema omphalodes (strain CBS 100304) TaxID=1076935 RepID=U4LDC6_PYROM|nr:Protein of unknown function [Pyronema omphalodes CBS 100304]